jgi:ABC-type hemin transport system ATPase subunit
MQTNYTASVNIIRDADRNLNYYPTPNAQRVVDKLVNDFRVGKRAFNIIGSYGTGKSSFLWALQQSLLGKKNYLTANFLTSPKIEIINLVGEYKSFAKFLAEYFDAENTAVMPNKLLLRFSNTIIN